MPITQKTKDLLATVMTEMNDIELAHLSDLIYESLLRENNKATTAETTTLGKHILSGFHFKEVNPTLKIVVMRSALYFSAKLPAIFMVKEPPVDVAPATPAQSAAPAPEAADPQAGASNGETPKTVMTEAPEPDAEAPEAG
jgi:hypothetical protein